MCDAHHEQQGQIVSVVHTNTAEPPPALDATMTSGEGGGEGGGMSVRHMSLRAASQHGWMARTGLESLLSS